MIVTTQTLRQRFAPSANDVPRVAAEKKMEFGLFFFGDKDNHGHYWMRDESAEIHYKIHEVLAYDIPFYYLTAPREFGKSFHTQLLDPVYRIVNIMEPYILLIEKNEKAGIRVMDNIKYELRHNSKLIQVYGEHKPLRGGKDDYRYSKSESRFNNGVFIRCVGMMGDVRGALDRMYRYTLIIINDPQNMKTMREPATLASHIEFLERDVEPAFDSTYGKIRIIGNMLGDGCLIQSVVGDEKYEGTNFSALVNDNGEPDINGKSIWEARFPTERLHKERDRARARGKLYVFMAERMNIIVEEGKQNLKGWQYHNAEFRREYGQNRLVLDNDTEIPVNTYYVIDPAFSRADNADPRAGVVMALGRFPYRDHVGKPVMVNGVWILEYDYSHHDPTTLIDRGLELHRKYYFNGLIIEANGPQQIFEYIGNKAMMSDEFVFKNPINFIPVRHVTGKKEDRILESLSQKCKLGQFFIRPDMIDLEQEMTRFLTNPSGIHITDAIAMGLEYADVNLEELRTYSHAIRDYRRSRTEQGSLDLRNPVNIMRQLGL